VIATVSREQRHTRAHRCPICAGGDGDPRGRGKRCSGFASSNGEYVHCSREELAGGIAANGAGLFAHRMHGSCHCGQTHGPESSAHALDTIEATYPYTDERGSLLFEVVRKSGKKFLQRRPDGAGGWDWSTKNVRRVLYRLVDLVEDDANRTVHIVEGEKDVETLVARGFLATCNPGGAGKWRFVADSARQVLADRDVVVIADRDDVGRQHALEVADSLRGVARSLVTLECPAPSKDVSDLLIAGGSLSQLLPFSADAESADADDGPAFPWIERVAPCVVDWFTEPPPRRAWLLRDARVKDAGVLPLGKVGLITGEGGVSKTMVMIALALSVSSHEPHPWLGCFSVPNQGRVLLLLGEEDAEEVRRRLFNARKSSDAPVPEPGAIVVLPLAGIPVPMIESDERGNPLDGSFLVWLRIFIKEQGPFALVIVDPLSRFAGKDAEIDNAMATRFVQALESVANASGATVLCVHHTNKTAPASAGRQAVRGSSAIYDGVRWAAALSAERLETSDKEVAERFGELVTLSVVKSNYSRKSDPVTLRRDHENGGALLPLSEAERECAAQVRASADPNARRRAERDAYREEQEARVEAERGRKQADAAARTAARREAEDAAVQSSVAAEDGINEARLLAAVRARLGTCSDTAARAAIERARLAGWLQLRTGPRNAKTHHLREVTS
jgi:RecA-family ATPase